MSENTQRGKRSLCCRLGLHTAERSQGVVGYCVRLGCGDLKRKHRHRTIWIRYVEPPTGSRPGGSLRPGRIQGEASKLAKPEGPPE